MVSHSQKSLPLRASTRHNDGRPIAVVSRIRHAAPARSRAAAANPPIEPVSNCWKDTKGSFSSAHRRAVWAQDVRAASSLNAGSNRAGAVATLAGVATADTEPGDAFARNRIQHALDLFGACMMIAAVMAFAMFA